jgi:uncharacterized DUF497 family protein
MGFGKASSNAGKHGVTFEVACQVFFDRFIHILDASIDEENRDAAIGMTEDWMLLLVVHIQRDGGTIRIISARPATAQERRSYEDGYWTNAGTIEEGSSNDSDQHAHPR